MLLGDPNLSYHQTATLEDSSLLSFPDLGRRPLPVDYED
jgi:hypothetical protein